MKLKLLFRLTPSSWKSHFMIKTDMKATGLLSYCSLSLLPFKLNKFMLLNKTYIHPLGKH